MGGSVKPEPQAKQTTLAQWRQGTVIAPLDKLGVE